MDPLSAVASVSQLIVLAGEILGACYEYGCAVSHAPKEMRRLVDETTALSGIFVTLQGLVNANRIAAGQKEELSQLISECQRTLCRIRDILQSMKPKTANSGKWKFDTAVKRLLWPLKKPETEAILNQLSRHKATLNLLLSTEATLEARQTQVTLYELQESFEEVQRERDFRETTKRWAKIYRWLCEVDYHAMHDQASSLRSPGTGKWILQNEEFSRWLDWLDNASNFLWINGIPGSGKTILTSAILNQYLLPKASKTAPVCYYYCDFRSHQSCRPESVLGAIISQLCQALETMPREVEGAFSRHVGKDGKLVAASLQELERLLRSLISGFPFATIVVDALDECNDKETMARILKELAKVDAVEPRVIVTSRREIDIVRVFKDRPSISTHNKVADQDIHQYICATIEGSLRLRNLSQSLKGSVIETLADGAGGMFRWVSCQLVELGKLRTDAAIKSALKGLPRDLDETYERILGRISEPDIPIARQALLWLAHSSCRLTLTELAEGAILRSDADRLNQEDKLNDPEDILEILGALVSEDGSHIVLAHNSVRDYLLSDRAASKMPTFHLPESNCIPELASICVNYLLLCPLNTGPSPTPEEMQSRLEAWPLLRYASHNWPDHARDYLSTSSSLFNLTLKFFSSTNNFHSWVQLLLVHPDNIPFTYRGYPRNPTPLYYATSFGLTPIVQYLLDHGADINEPGGRVGGPPLHAACWRGWPELVRLLLRAGADPNSMDKSGVRAVDLASVVQNEEVNKVFLEEKNINIRTRGPRRENNMRSAVAHTWARFSK